MSSGVIAYLGPFTIPYRREAVAQWRDLCVEKRLPSSDKFDLQEIVGDPVQIRAWTIQVRATTKSEDERNTVVT